ncbi:hypothetical protein WG907_16745 [Sphingobium sp. AN558]|uniref:hypothetical protein n=1 Tax=Sphingobium sp. AN558 TaxID=3133442 RepID=UPI0030BF7914
MQLFLIDYGLWLLLALFVVIAVVFLLSGRGRRSEYPASRQNDTPEPIVPSLLASDPQGDLIAAAPVEPAMEALVPAEPVVSITDAALSRSDPAPSPEAGQPDDLLRLKGVGPKLRTMLAELGVTRFSQIADWTDSDIAAVDAKLGAFRGRPVRDQWVDQAKYLAAGDVAGFEAKYGKL